MWLTIALAAVFVQVLRRSTEKSLTGRMSAGSMAWLQQLVALPFMVALLPFATFYWPDQLGPTFWTIVILYVLATSLDVIFYFKALEVGDLSIVSSMLPLSIVTSLVGTYILLGQKPTFAGIVGAICIITGAYLASRKPASHISTATNNRLAIILMLLIALLRGFYGPAEVTGIRITNPLYFNFITSLLGVPCIMLIIFLRGRSSGQPLVSGRLLKLARHHKIGLLFIGLTYTLNLTATYTAKFLAPNAAYVTTIKASVVLPMMLVGFFIFHEKIHRPQWFGLTLILVGLGCFIAI